jgi:antitoxin (DNA-binding transcriptional repressor) of toxin-antitoxin stability system
MPRRRAARAPTDPSMTYTEERVAAEMGRVLLALYRAGMQVHLCPDAIRGRASARIVAGPSAKRRREAPRSAKGAGDSPLQAIYAAVERMNERAGAIVVPLD